MSAGDGTPGEGVMTPEVASAEIQRKFEAYLREEYHRTLEGRAAIEETQIPGIASRLTEAAMEGVQEYLVAHPDCALPLSWFSGDSLASTVFLKIGIALEAEGLESKLHQTATASLVYIVKEEVIIPIKD